MELKPFLPAIAGPTASGKTACAVRFAMSAAGEVVSCDSMQVYRGMDVLTAMPAPDETLGVPHHMLGVFAPGDVCTASRYRDMALAAVGDILARGKLPVLCGGTGLYIDALTRPMSFSAPGDPALRAELDEIAAQPDGKARLHRMLEALDPISARKYHENDVRRVRRAVEICRLTGKTQSEQAKLDAAGDAPASCAVMALLWPMDELYARCDARVDGMVERGLVNEVQRLMEAGDALPTARQAIGFKEIRAALLGECGMNEAIDRVKTATRHYAKRQMTWLRRDERTVWIPARGRTADSLAAEMAEIYQKRKAESV